ncbi:hypothetical protein BDA99DRAFT_444161 [Phascolomyces articulosus]|uniref:SET domain-containing protein n=1 Tax=Phascolomyces articulosus TaxID=60185 RepID=A0AAD5JSU2_9FUNG|nr:hypothetical protein BDA99DRAFT_444161 [Phascolomyces articulosus]
MLDEILLEPKYERLTLRLFLVLQKFSNEQQASFWKPYIDILPSLDEVRQQHVLFLVHDMDGLDGTNLNRAANAKLSALTQEWTMMKELVKWMTLEMWIWADIIFWSRVVSVGSSSSDMDDGDNDKNKGDLTLIPFFDFANHSSCPSIRWCPAKKEGGGIDFVANPTYEKSLAGNELFISYGDKSNQELLFLHGFTLENNTKSSRITEPLTGFMNMSLEENQFKLSWITQFSAPVLTLMASSTTDDDDNKNKTDKVENDITLRTGWTPESVALMYLVALSQEDGLGFEIIPDISQLNISSNMIIQLSLGDQVVEDLDDLSLKVAKLDNSAVIQLRVVILLLDALEYHLQMITSSLSNDSKHSDIMVHVERYKQDEKRLIQKSVDDLTLLKDELMTHDSVISFIAAHEEES